MREVYLKENKTGLKVFVDGDIDFKEKPEEELLVLATVFEMIISRQFESYIKRKEGRKKDTV